MKGRAIRYSADEMAWLEANRLMVIGDYHRAFCEAFQRDDVTFGHLNSASLATDELLPQTEGKAKPSREQSNG